MIIDIEVFHSEFNISKVKNAIPFLLQRTYKCPSILLTWEKNSTITSSLTNSLLCVTKKMKLIAMNILEPKCA